MVNYLIVSRSLTHAQRTARALERAGITSIISRPPKFMSEEGCGYCVKISEKRLYDALVALGNAGIDREKIFILYDDGTSSEVHI